MKRIFSLGIAVAALVVVSAGCSSDESASGRTTTTASSDETTTTTASGTDAYVDVEVQPGTSTDDYVGARQDVTVDQCEPSDGGWVASGEVTNGSGASAKYRIYVALNTADSATSRALVQIDAEVADGESSPWDVTVPIEDQDLTCILRVERVAA